MSEALTEAQAVDKLRGLIQEIPIAVLTTVRPGDGSLHSRPMGVAGEIEADNSLWFFTHENDPKVQEAVRDPQASVVFSDTKKQNYVALSGTVNIVTDKAEIIKRWNPILKGWFPKGPDTPDLALLHFSPNRGEYWEAEHDPLVRGFEFAKSAIFGATPDLGENRQVRL